MPQQKDAGREVPAAEDFGASSRARVATLVDGDLVALATRQILVGPVLYLAAITVSLLDPRLSLLAILAVPVLHVLPGPFHLYWTR